MRMLWVLFPFIFRTQLVRKYFVVDLSNEICLLTRIRKTITVTMEALIKMSDPVD